MSAIATVDELSKLVLGEFKPHAYYQETQSQIHIVLKDVPYNGTWTKDFETIVVHEDIVGVLIYTGGFNFALGDTVHDFVERIGIYANQVAEVPVEVWDTCKHFPITPLERL